MINIIKILIIQKQKPQGLRNYHQWLKTQLYKKYIKKGDKVLEIAIGRGGDLKKH